MIIIITLVLFSCCLNVVFLEALIRKDPGSGNLITFSQFLFVALEGFIFTSHFGRNQRHVPLKNYILLVVLFFLTSVMNNYALNFDISMPLHMIFKSGSLVANMLLGVLIMQHQYSMSKYVSVIMVTSGIIIATIASHNEKKIEDKPSAESPTSSSFIGIFLLTSALIISASLGLYQETLFLKYGKHPKEALFYSHALPLPGFVILFKDIYSHSLIFSRSESITTPLLGNVPIMWLYLLGNVLTQYVCVRSVFTLTTISSSLTVTMVITLRKFISLVFSIIYFQNPFTTTHWMATFLIFIGTLVFTDIPFSVYKSIIQKKSQKLEE